MDNINPNVSIATLNINVLNTLSQMISQLNSTGEFFTSEPCGKPNF